MSYSLKDYIYKKDLDAAFASCSLNLQNFFSKYLLI